MSAAVMEAPLRQMIAVLESERQALAGLDIDALLALSHEKLALCDTIEAATPITLNEATRDLAETARRMNEVNRRVRNLLAANVAARIDALSGGAITYRMAQAAAR